MKTFLYFFLVILIPANGATFSSLYCPQARKIVPADWQHWKSGGSHFELKVTSTGFTIDVTEAGTDKRDIQVYSNNELQIGKDKSYIVRFKARSNKDSVTFNSRLGAEAGDRDYYYRAIKVEKAKRSEIKEVRFSQSGDPIKFLKLYFDFGQIDPGTSIEISDVEIVEEK
ncbi:MAG: hypothetical protein WCO02_18630 [Bacteroidota bacterium]